MLFRSHAFAQAVLQIFCFCCVQNMSCDFATNLCARMLRIRLHQLGSLGIHVREGVACTFDEEENMFMPDFDVTVVYEGEIASETWMYYEQDGILITLANWLNGRMPIDAIEKLECYIKIANVTD